MKTIHWSGMTHPGRVRKNNEDGFLGLILYEREAHYLGKEGEHVLEGNQFVFAVSDGMGGANAGDFASKLALQSVMKRMPLAVQKADTSTPENKQKVMKNVFLDIHDEIIATSRFYEECRGMGATLSLCWVNEDCITIGHIGDSRIYHIPLNEPIRQLSLDHSRVGKLQREGKLNERQAKTHPQRHILDQSIGASSRVLDPQTETFSVKDGDNLILCSDGICDGLYDRSIETTIIRPAANIKDLRPSERLIKEALYNSGRDNLTSMVIRFS